MKNSHFPTRNALSFLILFLVLSLAIVSAWRLRRVFRSPIEEPDYREVVLATDDPRSSFGKWRLTGDSTGSISPEKSDEDGGSYLRLISPSRGKAYASQTFKLSTENRVRDEYVNLSFDSKTDLSEGTFLVTFSFSRDADSGIEEKKYGQLAVLSTEALSGKTDWSPQRARFKIPEGTDRISIILRCDGKGCVDVKDVRLVKEAAVDVKNR